MDSRTAVTNRRPPWQTDKRTNPTNCTNRANRVPTGFVGFVGFAQLYQFVRFPVCRGGGITVQTGLDAEKWNLRPHIDSARTADAATCKTSSGSEFASHAGRRQSNRHLATTKPSSFEPRTPGYACNYFSARLKPLAKRSPPRCCQDSSACVTPTGTTTPSPRTSRPPGFCRSAEADPHTTRHDRVFLA